MTKTPIVILDRSQSFLHLLVYVLQQRNAAEVEVVAAENDVDALILQAATTPAVVLLGLSVPNLVDPLVIQKLRAHWPSIGIIALSWLEGAEYHSLALAAGANLVISKTQLDTALLPAIRQIAGNHHNRRHSDDGAEQQSA